METKEKLYITLLEESFPGIKANIIRCETLGFSWEASKLFTKEVIGKTLSHVALFECPMLVDGQWHTIGALHGICTQADSQGHGYATELISEALHWSKGRCDTVLLFTGIPAFYERLSFKQIQEHRFHLSLPCSKGSQSLRPVIAPQDNDLFLRCFSEREPLSNRLWIKDNGLIASFNTLFATSPTYWSVYYSPTINGLISYYLDDKTLHLLDIVASKMPSLDVILDHLPAEVDDIYFYFSPDRFTDEAIPEPYLYDHGHLLIHGPWEISNPFMISPLSRC
jgi:GNAT superfamily N-acetyltransferase